MQWHVIYTKVREEFHLSDVSSNWFPIRSTKGIAPLLRFSMATKPVQIPDLIVDYLQQRCAKKEPLYELFKLREILEITQGSFKGFTGFLKKFKVLLMI